MMAPLRLIDMAIGVVVGGAAVVLLLGILSHPMLPADQITCRLQMVPGAMTRSGEFVLRIDPEHYTRPVFPWRR